MKPEEAINVLFQVRDVLINSNSWLESTKEPITDAFNLAIEALSKSSEIPNSSDDLISRQAVIDELISEPPEINYGFYYAEKIKALSSAQPDLTEEDWKLIKKLRSFHNGTYAKVLDKLMLLAQSKPQWIPCSERLPEKPNIYTVTDSKGDVVRFVFYNTESSREYWLRCAKAWMPLPEPYRAERRTD